MPASVALKCVLLIHSACIHGALPKSHELGREGKREMNHSLHPGGADGKDRKVNRFAWSCRNTERRVMDCAARRGFTGKPSKKISDETEHPNGVGEGIWRGRCAGEAAWLKQRLCPPRKPRARGSH